MKRFTHSLFLWNYSLATLLSAFLLFEIQPLISKFILPWFGGSPAVWTTAMVFFQTMLFAGYAYAHLSERYLPPVWQAAVHTLLLAGAVLVLPIAPDPAWRLHEASAPTARILALLAVSVGLPYFVLSSTGPLVQAWFARTNTGKSPYRLYALSNIGSLVALLSYPFFFERRFDLVEQSWQWGLGFAAFAVLCAAAVWRASKAPRPQEPSSASPQESRETVPGFETWLAWLLLPALASMMLLATTNHICQDVAAMPFLWVAPLSLYLLSFILCFDHPRWYARRGFALATLLTLGLVAVVDVLITGGAGIAFSFKQELALHLAALFCLCMVCHGELYRRRPEARHITSFYLMISAGGAIGGLFVSLLAPHLFSTFVEWRFGLALGCLLAAKVAFDDRPQSLFHRRFGWIAGSLAVAFIGIKTAPALLSADGPRISATARNFYGVISVIERNAEDPARDVLNFYSGRIVHGVQFRAPELRRTPTAYFGRDTGVGQTLAALADRTDLRVGIIGLGIGTMATYAQPGQSFRFYEINEDVKQFAEKYFSYLSDCQGTTDVVLGDGRLSLEREANQDFDALILDAFSGDAVPTHLLTREAFTIYRRHLKPGAVVAVNISNRYLDLSPVINGLADHFGYDTRRVTTAGNAELGQFAADWIMLTPAAEPVGRPGTTLTAAEESWPSILWTDDRCNLFEILK